MSPPTSFAVFTAPRAAARATCPRSRADLIGRLDRAAERLLGDGAQVSADLRGGPDRAPHGRGRRRADLAAHVLRARHRGDQRAPHQVEHAHGEDLADRHGFLDDTAHRAARSRGRCGHGRLGPRLCLGSRPFHCHGSALLFGGCRSDGCGDGRASRAADLVDEHGRERAPGDERPVGRGWDGQPEEPAEGRHQERAGLEQEAPADHAGQERTRRPRSRRGATGTRGPGAAGPT